MIAEVTAEQGLKEPCVTKLESRLEEQLDTVLFDDTKLRRKEEEEEEEEELKLKLFIQTSRCVLRISSA